MSVSASNARVSEPAPVTATRTWPPFLATKTPTMAYRDAGFGNVM